MYGEIKTNNALDGKNVAFIHNTLDLNDRLIIRHSNSGREGYVIQTVHAENFIGKHYHVSAYIRTKPIDIEKTVDEYKARYAEKLRYIYETRYGETVFEVNDAFKRRLDQINNRFRKILEIEIKKIEFGITAYLHKNNKIDSYSMTRKPAKEFSDWQRFNLEIAIPEETEYFTIAVWFQGLGTAYIDHFAVVEQGVLKPTESRSPRWITPNTELGDFVLSSQHPEKKDFANLSFEKKAKVDLIKNIPEY